MATSVGMMSVDTGFAPFAPVARCPLVATVTKIRQRGPLGGMNGKRRCGDIANAR